MKVKYEPNLKTNPQTGERYCATCGEDLDENGECKCETYTILERLK